VKIAVVNGPNLNLLGTREPEVYGRDSLASLDHAVLAYGRELRVEVGVFQSNHEGELIDHIHGQAASTDGFVVNAGAYTHTSIALADALLGVARPFVEVHLSNVFSREGFRHHSYLAAHAVGVVSGFGARSYRLGLWALVEHLKEREAASGSGAGSAGRNASPA
jgi:3-dehydroquinate dehydratase II